MDDEQLKQLREELAAANKRAEEANKRAEESNKRAEESNKRAEEADKKLKEVRELGRGEYFTQIVDMLKTTQGEFEGGFDNICGRMRDENWRKAREEIPAYKSLVSELDLKAANRSVKADDLTLTSSSVRDHELGGDNLSKEEKEVKKTREKNKVHQKSLGIQVKDLPEEFKSNVQLADEGVVTNSAHLLPNNKTCSVTMGIFVQAIVGHDFEAKINKSIKTAKNQNKKGRTKIEAEVKELERKKIKLLQQLAFHKKDPYKGFCHLECNQVYLPKSGHEKFFDVAPRWLIVPVMPLAQILKWNPNSYQSSYWVMVVCGNLVERDNKAYLNFIQASQDEDDENHVYSPGKREQCTESEIREGIANITAFVQAIADLATGRGQDLITPFDLVDDKNLQDNNIEQYRAARDKIDRCKKVTLPELKEELQHSEIKVMKLKIEHANPAKLTEPMALCAKAALNFMDFNNEKCVPACPEEHASDEESSDTESSEEEDYGSHSSVGPTCRSDIPEYVAIVTPPSTPPCNLERSDSADSGDL